MKTVKLFKLLVGFAIGAMSFGYSSPFQDYSGIVNAKITFSKDAPNFAFTSYNSNDEYMAVYIKNYKEFERLRFVIMKSKSAYEKYLESVMEKDANGNLLVTPKQWIKLALESPYRKPLLYGGQNVKDKIVSANNALIEQCKKTISENPNNTAIKLFLIELESFNTSLALLGTAQFTGKNYSDLTTFCHKYMR